MDIIEVLKVNGFWAFIVYVILRDMLIPLVKKYSDKAIPEVIARKKIAEEQLNELKEKEINLLERQLDVEERRTISLEQIGKALIIVSTDHKLIERLISDNQNHNQVILQSIATSLSAIMTNTGILIDRSQRIRKSDEDIT